MRKLISILPVIVAASATLAMAQQPDPAAMKQRLQQRLGELKQTMARDQAALATYTWVETTEISLKGEVKPRKQNNCTVGPDGEVQKEEVGEGGGQQKKGRKTRGLKGKAIAKKKQQKVGEIQGYMDRVMSLIGRYVPPNQSNIQAAVQAGNASVSRVPQGGTATLAFKNYVKEGDSMSIVFDSAASSIKGLKIASYLDGPDDIVTTDVSYARLADGTNYVGETLLNATGQKIGVKVTNFGHRRTQ